MLNKLLKSYSKPFLVTILFFFFFSFYLYLRRGYFDLYIANKVFGSVPVATLALVVMIGPLSRAYQRFDAWILIRKELGILAMGMTVIHGIISLFFLPDRFQPDYYFTPEHRIPFLFGLFGILLLMYLFILSWEYIIKKIDKKQWWHIQNWGIRIAMVAILLHIILLKYPGWLKWYADGGNTELLRPYMLPGRLMAGGLGIYVFFARLVFFIGQKALKLVIPICTFMLVAFLLISFYWGYRKTPDALPLSWDACTKISKSITTLSYPAICTAPDGRSVTKL